jgi:hypothetical protein
MATESPWSAVSDFLLEHSIAALDYTGGPEVSIVSEKAARSDSSGALTLTQSFRLLQFLNELLQRSMNRSPIRICSCCRPRTVDCSSKCHFHSEPGGKEITSVIGLFIRS